MAKGAHKKGGFQKREPKEFEETVIQIDRVTRVVKGGRKLRFRATVAIGDKKNRVGIGIGKSHEVTGAIQKAIAKAKKNLINVILDGTTLPHEVKLKYKSAKIYLIPAAPGTGIIAGGTIRKVLELAGVKDILSKSFGTTNKVNNTRATYEALKVLKETPLMDKKKKLQAQQRQEEDKKKKEEAAKKPENKKKAAPKKSTTKSDK